MKMKMIERYMRNFKYEDKRVERLLGIFDDNVRFIRDYDDEFEMGEAETPAMLAGYRNNGFGILLALLHLGYITTADFHHRMHAMNMVYFEKVPA